ncbi:MAG: MarR family transcriptional regulator [Solirubrobacterales bacterium]|nr:MarR family transcriptional regulator [Solirubrobacterales bacterium]
MHELMRGTGGRVVETLNEYGLSLTQMKALYLLDEPTEEVSVKVLGTCLAMSLPAASRTADSLLLRGLVTRHEDPEDRRIKRLLITPEGREVLRTLEAVRLDGVERWAQALTTTQRDALHAALLTLHDGDDDHPDNEGPR